MACVFRSSSSDSIHPQVYYRRALGAGDATFSQMPFILGPLHVTVPLPSSFCESSILVPAAGQTSLGAPGPPAQ